MAAAHSRLYRTPETFRYLTATGVHTRVVGHLVKVERQDVLRGALPGRPRRVSPHSAIRPDCYSEAMALRDQMSQPSAITPMVSTTTRTSAVR